MIDKLLGENIEWKFYDNSLTGFYKKCRIVLAQNKKTKEKTYIVIKNNEVIYENQQIEAIWCWIDFYTLANKKEN